MIYMADLAKKRQRRLPRRIATCQRWKWSLSLLLLAVFVKFVKCPCVRSFVKFVMSIRFAKPFGERLTIWFVAQREISIKNETLQQAEIDLNDLLAAKKKCAVYARVCVCLCVCEYASKRRCMIKKIQFSAGWSCTHPVAVGQLWEAAKKDQKEMRGKIVTLQREKDNEREG